MKRSKQFVFLCLFAFAVAAIPACAQQPSPAGAVTVAANATIGNAPLTEGATIFSGDPLKTGDNGRLQVQAGSVQFTLADNTSARIFRDENRILVELERGTILYNTKGANEDLRIFALDVRLVPHTNGPAQGQVHIVSRCDVDTTAVRGQIDITSGRESKTVEESKSYRVTSAVGVDYKDSWQPIPADYPDYPHDAAYHRSHGHVACAADIPRKTPVAGMGGGAHIIELTGGIIAILTIPPIIKAFESPDRP
jgi:hypothetical protein